MKGEYKDIPKGSIIMIIAGILYVVSPVDLVPDFIAYDLEKFKIWKENR